MRHLTSNSTLLRAACLLFWITAPATAETTVKHYGYSGQDKMLQCMQHIFGKYAAGFPNTVLYGRPPRYYDLQQIVNDHWEAITERVDYPPISDLSCPSTRDKVVDLLQNKVAKLLAYPATTPLGTKTYIDPGGIRIFETPQWVYIIPAMEFSATLSGVTRQEWKKVDIKTQVDGVEGISEDEGQSLISQILNSARTTPIIPELAASGIKSPEEIEVNLHFRFYKLKLHEGERNSIVTIMDSHPMATVARLIYGEIDGERYHTLWDSPLLNSNGRLDLADVNGDGWKELVWRASTCGAQNCVPEELTIFDHYGDEITRQRKCYIDPFRPFTESDGVCPIVGDRIIIDEMNLQPGNHAPAQIQVEDWATDGKRRIFKLNDGTYVPFRPDAVEPLTMAEDAADLNADGMELMRHGKYRDAAGKFVVAAELDPGNALYPNNAGFAFYKEADYNGERDDDSRYDESIKWFGKAITLDPKRAVAYLNRGDALVKQHHYASNSIARKDYEKFLELAPDSSLAATVRKKLQSLPAR